MTAKRYDVDVTAVPAQALAVLRERAPLTSIGERMRRLRTAVAEAGLTVTGPMMARFYDAADPEVDHDVCLPVAPAPDGSLPDTIAGVRGEWVPAHHALTTRHVGPHEHLEGAVAALHEALTALGYTACGPLTEVYVTGRADGVQPSRYVTDLRLPYAR